MRIEFEDGNIVYSDSDIDPYYRLFLSNVALNETCYKCKYKGDNSQADITIGDYWGGDILNPMFYNQNGTSLVVVRSNKGQKLFDTIQDDANVISVDYSAAARCNPCLTTSVSRPNARDIIFLDFKKYSFDTLADTYAPLSYKDKTKLILKKMKVLGLVIGAKRTIYRLLRLMATL